MTQHQERHAALERYLLGLLPLEEQEQLEERLFEDDELLPTLQDAEDELIDRYLEGALSAEERVAFERHFAASALRQQRIAFRRALPGALAQASRPAGETGGTRGDLSRATPWAPGWGVAALLVLALGWVVAQRQPVERPPSGSSLTPQPGPTGPDPRGPALPERAALLLRSGQTRDSGTMPRLVVPTTATVVRIDVQLDSAASPQPHRAELRSAEGTVVWRGTVEMQAGARRASVVIPAAVLQPGDYLLAVHAEGPTAVDGAEYPLRVVIHQGAPEVSTKPAQ